MCVILIRLHALMARQMQCVLILQFHCCHFNTASLQTLRWMMYERNEHPHSITDDVKLFLNAKTTILATSGSGWSHIWPTENKE